LKRGCRPGLFKTTVTLLGLPMAEHHDCVAEMIRNWLRSRPTEGDPECPPAGNMTAGLAKVLKVQLSPDERLLLAVATTISLGHVAAERLAEVVLSGIQNGEPMTPFTTLREEARDWAALASLAELRAYLSACWNRLPRAEQDEFLDAVGASRREPA
jgi:hypothetical protein